mmetsp:Transcript_1102/g.3502  ORF Transcript_1102/g.3502 Transcript_1102/m.3502 type:complete len:225 (-) Transcript_1102:159-833(-)
MMSLIVTAILLSGFLLHGNGERHRLLRHLRSRGIDVVENFQSRSRGNAHFLKRAVVQQQQAVIGQETFFEVLLVLFKAERREHRRTVRVIHISRRILPSKHLPHLHKRAVQQRKESTSSHRVRRYAHRTSRGLSTHSTSFRSRGGTNQRQRRTSSKHRHHAPLNVLHAAAILFNRERQPSLHGGKHRQVQRQHLGRTTKRPLRRHGRLTRHRRRLRLERFVHRA